MRVAQNKSSQQKKNEIKMCLIQTRPIVMVRQCLLRVERANSFCDDDRAMFIGFKDYNHCLISTPGTELILTLACLE